MGLHVCLQFLQSFQDLLRHPFCELGDADVAQGVGVIAQASRTDRAQIHMHCDTAKAELAANIDDALQLGVPGIPCVVSGQELFFGADRLPQLRWRLGLPSAPAS